MVLLHVHAWAFIDLAVEYGFCDYEVTITNRGNYTWVETEGNSDVSLDCQLGPAEGVEEPALAIRTCDPFGEWQDSVLDQCITIISSRLRQLEERVASVS